MLSWVLLTALVYRSAIILGLNLRVLRVHCLTDRLVCRVVEHCKIPTKKEFVRHQLDLTLAAEQASEPAQAQVLLHLLMEAVHTVSILLSARHIIDSHNTAH